jgi:hypothetical protein
MLDEREHLAIPVVCRRDDSTKSQQHYVIASFPMVDIPATTTKAKNAWRRIIGEGKIMGGAH